MTDIELLNLISKQRNITEEIVAWRVYETLIRLLLSNGHILDIPRNDELTRKLTPTYQEA